MKPGWSGAQTKYPCKKERGHLGQCVGLGCGTHFLWKGSALLGHFRFINMFFFFVTLRIFFSNTLQGALASWACAEMGVYCQISFKVGTAGYLGGKTLVEIQEVVLRV